MAASFFMPLALLRRLLLLLRTAFLTSRFGPRGFAAALFSTFPRELLLELLHLPLHKLARDAWRFGCDENLRMEDLIREKYRGIRPAAGYPACPDHAEKKILFDLLDAEKNAEIKLTESFAMHPGASVSGLYFSHPEAKYFGVGKIGRDQIEDYAGRSGEPVAAVEKRLATNLGYEPGK